VSRDGTLAYQVGTPGAPTDSLGTGRQAGAAGEPANGILIVQNWAAELKRRAAEP